MSTQSPQKPTDSVLLTQSDIPTTPIKVIDIEAHMAKKTQLEARADLVKKAQNCLRMGMVFLLFLAAISMYSFSLPASIVHLAQIGLLTGSIIFAILAAYYGLRRART